MAKMRKDYLVSNKTAPILFLIIFVVIVRIPYIAEGIIPFGFDHGKDSIAILHMIKTNSLKFIGPWTSIPGLFFGPAWYYLLAPAYILTNGSPVGAAYVLFILGIVTTLLVYKFFGFLEALITISSPAWRGISVSAWNPFPMALISLIIFRSVTNAVRDGRLKRGNAFLIASLSALGFHFSSAFAVFYPIIIGLIIAVRRLKVSFNSFLAACLGFVWPFLPQLLFEMKHNFLQTKAILKYFSLGEPHSFKLGKLIEVLYSIIGELKLAVLPERLNNFSFLYFLTVLILLYSVIRASRNIYKIEYLNEAAIFLLVPTLGYFFLHYNVWYVIGLFPVALYIVGQLLRTVPQKLVLIYMAILIITPGLALEHYFSTTREQLIESKSFLPIKLKVIDYIYRDSAGSQFSSFHYVPDIYDYSYQYLCLISAYNGKQLPAEFSYKPGESTYIPEKMDLLRDINSSQNTKKPQYVYYIVEKPIFQQNLDEWWSQQKYSKLIDQKNFGNEITVYKALSL